jgi:hypothetical protein
VSAVQDRAWAERVPCRLCSAEPGVPCAATTPKGEPNPTFYHVVRLVDAKEKYPAADRKALA